jgi:hypothetical protein
MESARTFDWEDVGGLLHDAKKMPVAPRVGTKRARVAFGEETALRTRVDGFLNSGDGAAQGFGVGVPRLQHPKGDALRTACPDAWQACEFFNESPERGRIFGAFHSDGLSLFCACE